MSAPRVLLALPAPGEARELEAALLRAELACTQAALERGWDELLAEGGPFDAVLADAELDSAGLLAASEALPDAPAVVLLAGFGTAQSALESIRRGAADSLARPLAADEVAVAVTKALEARALRRENRALRARLSERFTLGQLQSRDPKIARIAAIVDSVADTRATILISGESGTGKTLLARAVHQRSSRRAAPFVELNCGALPASLLESELFGHARGAFTGALRDKPGLFEAADGGTLFLDEIGTASLDLQVKLLRVLQDRAFERVGETRTRTADVRVIAATNADLLAAVAAGRFREDLYWRLNVIAFHLPPLRERPGDVALLAEAFLQRFARDYARDVSGLEPDCLARLCAYAWPGNVRQLENTIERAVLLCQARTLSVGDLPREIGAAQAAAPAASLPPPEPGARFPTLKQALSGPERELILRALERTGGRRQEAAALLGINRTTLFNKMRKHGLLDAHPPTPCDSPPGCS
jgi:DNA-binding NtrC family response regulator